MPLAFTLVDEPDPDPLAAPQLLRVWPVTTSWKRKDLATPSVFDAADSDQLVGFETVTVLQAGRTRLVDGVGVRLARMPAGIRLRPFWLGICVTSPTVFGASPVFRVAFVEWQRVSCPPPSPNFLSELLGAALAEIPGAAVRIGGVEEASKEGNNRPEQEERSSKRTLLVLVVAAVAALAVGMTAVVVSRPRGEAIAIVPDVGGAPEGRPTGYLELSGVSPPARLGNFFNGSADGGPLHLDSGVVFLGSSTGRESPDLDPELQDDGLTIPWDWATPDSGDLFSGLMPCTRNRVVVSIDLTRMPEKLAQEDAYLNAFFDWDRNGKFEGSDGCAEEWALKNHRIRLASLPRESGIPIEVEIEAGRQTVDFWYRTTLTVGEEVGPGQPENPFRYGETEDAHFTDPGVWGASYSPDPNQRHAGTACGGRPQPTVGDGTVSLVLLDVLPSGTRATPEGVSVAPIDGRPSDVRVGEALPALGNPPTRSTSWLELHLPPDPSVRRFKVDYTSAGVRKSCLVTQVSRAAIPKGLGPTTETRLPRTSPPVETETRRQRVVCPSRILTNGERQNVGTSQLGAAPGRSYGIVLPSPPLDVTATSTGAVIGLTAPMSRTSIASTFAADAVDATGELINSIECIVTVAARLPQRARPYEAPPTAADSLGRSPTPGGQVIGVTGTYSVRFAKKSDSCGNFPVREEDTLQVRPREGRMEIFRPNSGNRSTGNLLADNSFQATGAGLRKDGRSYVEQYQGRFAGDVVSGNYELQEGECRATFSFEGSRQ